MQSLLIKHNACTQSTFLNHFELFLKFLVFTGRFLTIPEILLVFPFRFENLHITTSLKYKAGSFFEATKNLCKCQFMLQFVPPKKSSIQTFSTLLLTTEKDCKVDPQTFENTIVLLSDAQLLFLFGLTVQDYCILLPVFRFQNEIKFKN